MSAYQGPARHEGGDQSPQSKVRKALLVRGFVWKNRKPLASSTRQRAASTPVSVQHACAGQVPPLKWMYAHAPRGVAENPELRNTYG